jgi:hypothetical protein
MTTADFRSGRGAKNHQGAFRDSLSIKVDNPLHHIPRTGRTDRAGRELLSIPGSDEVEEG